MDAANTCLDYRAKRFSVPGVVKAYLLAALNFNKKLSL